MLTSHHYIDFWRKAIESRLTPEAITWVEAQLEKISTGEEKALLYGYGLAPKKVGKAPMALTGEEQTTFQIDFSQNVPHWSADQAVRVLFILSYPDDDKAKFLKVVSKLFQTGEVRELVTLYEMLPLLPHADEFVFWCEEGIRTNMRDVFCAMAHHNPYPSQHLTEASWNQLILKALFTGVPLYPIIGIEEKANATLAAMLCDYAKERWAASRQVSPELWRCVGIAGDHDALIVLEQAVAKARENEHGLELKATLLAISQSHHPEAGPIQQRLYKEINEIQQSGITWDEIGLEFSR